MSKSDFISEIMFEEHGTRVLITDYEADALLEEQKLRRLKSRMPQWFNETSNPDQGTDNIR